MSPAKGNYPLQISVLHGFLIYSIVVVHDKYLRLYCCVSYASYEFLFAMNLLDIRFCGLLQYFRPIASLFYLIVFMSL